ncbi:ribbon-helix-helix domain-containing protein [Belliella kenyensis]|uniref:Ribbon-helix-helix domain-containing protein n=1 Tax=Belliella kenyensis TaxID=1472724 RepID=A0ABV8EJG8_9BACT|nr:ribbon-helix-helix domain-containing protein [Belliella kenyensis]MCH7402736.1 ribbon-helix-helix domain-containing protein [Belliella kenyensis]MDN3603716.1 ribbon-helix-helix domain-containing protein [Belliella kenyensis]
MTTFTSSLPNDLLEMLDEHAKKLDIPKNKLIEKALRLYLEHLKRAAYVKSYSQAKTRTWSIWQRKVWRNISSI